MTPNESHSAILDAYLSRLSPAQIEALLGAHRRTWHEALNGSSSSSVEAQREARVVADAAIESMLPQDLNYLNRLILAHEDVLRQASSNVLEGS